MIFTHPVTQCEVRAFAGLVDENQAQLTVMSFVVTPGAERPTQLVIPVPRETTLVPIYPGLLDDVALCFDDTMTEQVFEAAQEHRTEVVPQKVDRLADLEGSPEIVNQLRQWYGDETALLCLTFDQETATHPIAYRHRARDDRRLFVPSRSSASSGVDATFNHSVYTINTQSSSGGIPPFTRRIQTAFRWDLVPDVRFPPIHSLHLFTHQGVHPNSDIFFTTRVTPVDSRIYLGGDGGAFHDKTRLRIIRYQPNGLRTFPIVNGAFLTSPGECDPFHFGGSECHFEEALLPEGEWGIKITDEVETDHPCVLWVRPWKVRQEYGKYLLDLEEK